MSLTSALFSTPAMDAVFGDRTRVQAMLDFELALARVEVSLGLLPSAVLEPLEQAASADRLDLDAIAAGSALAGNTAIPLVAALTRAVAEIDPEAAGGVHWGATSQDAMDTGLVLQVCRALPLLDADLARLDAALTTLARRHRSDVMAARTWLQQGPPTTFGLKAAGWLDAARRSRARLAAAGQAARVLQFGGACGTLAALGARGPEVAAALAGELDLALPPLPWHAHRERLVDLGCALGVLCGGLGKLARDLSLLMQTEVAEAFEPAAPGRGGSSTMPHKRNPVACAAALQASLRAPGLVATLLAAMPQEHERGLGGWQAEWETLPELFRLAAGALSHMAATCEGLEVDTGRMRANLDAARGLPMAESVSMALAERVGRGEAHHRLQAACARAAASGGSLADALRGDAAVEGVLGADAVARRLDPAAYLGAADAFINAVLEAGADHG